MSVTQFKSVKLATTTWTIKNWTLKLPIDKDASEAFYSPIFELKNYNGNDSKWRIRATPKFGDKGRKIVIDLELVDGNRPPDGFLKVKFKQKFCFGCSRTVATFSRQSLDQKFEIREDDEDKWTPQDATFEMSILKLA
jgi:hypothetical protein